MLQSMLSVLTAPPAGSPPIAVAQTQTAILTGGPDDHVDLNVTVAAGSTLLLCGFAAYGTQAASLSVADNVNGSWGAAVDVLSDPTFTALSSSFKFQNTTGGALTITLTCSIIANFIYLWFMELDNAKTTGGLDGHNANLQTASSGATITSGPITNANQPAMLVGFALNDTGDPPTVGEGGWSTIAVTGGLWEYLRVTATGTNAATYTSADFGGHMIFGFGVDEA